MLRDGTSYQPPTPITDFVPVGASLEDAYLNLTKSAVEYRTEGAGH